MRTDNPLVKGTATTRMLLSIQAPARTARFPTMTATVSSVPTASPMPSTALLGRTSATTRRTPSPVPGTSMGTASTTCWWGRQTTTTEGRPLARPTWFLAQALEPVRPSTFPLPTTALWARAAATVRGGRFLRRGRGRRWPRRPVCGLGGQRRWRRCCWQVPSGSGRGPRYFLEHRPVQCRVQLCGRSSPGRCEPRLRRGGRER